MNTETLKTIVLTIPEIQSLAIKIHQAGLLDEAESLYRRILEVDPDDLDTLNFLSMLCHQQERYQEAEAVIGRILQLAPDIADAHNNMGNVLEGLKRHDEAESCYLKAISLNPRHSSAHNNLGVLLVGSRRYEEALEAYRKAVELAPESSEYRVNFGNVLQKLGRLDEAVVIFQDVLVSNPKVNGAWQALARCYLMADRRDLAAGVYENWSRICPGDQSITYMLSACKGEDAPVRAPDAYIQKVFDNFAERFDSHLAKLDYVAPSLLCEALTAALPAHHIDILDAGCGTGQCGPLLKPYAAKLTGVDLSTGMMEKAAVRNVYDELIMDELDNYLGNNPECYDAIASADTLCYFGELESVFKNASKALRSGGLFAFTLEDCGAVADTSILHTHGRYAHARKYVEECLVAADFDILTFTAGHLRNESCDPVIGHIVVARKAV